MSVGGEIGSIARTAAVDATWRQWAALGAPISGKPAAMVVDPEALLLLSCTLREDERRLDDVLAWWARAGAVLLSVQRVRTLGARFPTSSQTGLAAFARAAVDEGDARWKSLAVGESDDALISRGKRGGEPNWAASPSLMLRLRAAFGVGVKADVLAVLIAMGGVNATVRELVWATGYTKAAIRRAVQEMLSARVVRGTVDRPATYYADISAWSTFLGLSAVERDQWRYHGDVFAFIAAVIQWGEESQDDGYLAASAARDIFEAHRTAFEINQIVFPEPRNAIGARFLEAFAEVVFHVTNWLSVNV